MTDDVERDDDEKKDQGLEESASASSETTNKPPDNEGTASDEKATKEKENKKKTVDWPLRDIEEPHENDVLYGRGGGTNHHPGNKRYRKMVEDRKLDYVNSKRLDKPLVALEIIRSWRGQDPPGRFLKMDEKTGLWNDVGDKKAREKTSQALREKAPLIRKQQEEERVAKEKAERGEDASEEESEKEEESRVKTTRFAEGTNEADGKEVKKAVLARDHSLGREFLGEGEELTLDRFSWQDPFQRREASGGAAAAAAPAPPSAAPAPPPPPPHGYPPRVDSHGSEAFRYSSQGSMGMPPLYESQTRYPSQGRYESWGSMPPGGHPPPPMPGYPYYPHHSGSWGPPRDASGGPPREHSLGQFPLPNASVGHPAPYAPFDSSRNGSWGYGQVYPPPGAPPPPPPPMYGVPTSPVASGGPTAPPPAAYAQPPQPRNVEYSPRSGGRLPPSPPYAVDPAVASMWSGQDQNEIAKSWSADDAFRGPAAAAAAEYGRPLGGSSSNHETKSCPKPDMVKRATSNQNETLETRPGLVGQAVKRAALNRDNSMASNRLKEKYIPGYPKVQFNVEQEVNILSDDLDRSTLETAAGRVKQHSLSKEDRISTVDQIAMDLMVKPVALGTTSRSSTIDALALDLDDDPLIKPEPLERSRTMEQIFQELKEGILKPASLSIDDRMTTKDYLDIVNEPIGEDGSDLIGGGKTDKPFIVNREASLGEWVRGV